jgi:glyoxylase-like metal-dependent hydrolase (beta-lactamase superfamily II)
VAGLSLAILAAAVLLVPAHLQVRGVAPALPDTAALRALLNEVDAPVLIHVINTSSQRSAVGLLAHTVVVVEWENGNLFMIDAGMDGPAAAEFGKLMETALGADPAVSHGTIAELLGDRIQRVKGVGFTHLHIDHTQGIESFCASRGAGARVYQVEPQRSLHNFNTKEGAGLVRDSCLTQETVSGQGLAYIDAFPGLGMAALGGHTPGSTLFAVAVNGKLWLLSGDTTNTKADLLSNIGKGFLYSYLLVPENTDRTEQLRRWLAALDAEDDIEVIVSHDLASAEASGLPLQPL